MGFQEVKKLLNNRRNDTRVEVEVEDRRQDGGAKVWVLGLSGIGGIALPLQQLKPIKTGRRRQDSGEEERRDGGGEEREEEEPTTPKGEVWRIPAEATTCPPAPKKRRTAVSIIRGGAAGRRCNCDDGEVLDEFFRVPADLEAVFVSRAAKAN
ncbi:unnamed protein product [Urochloa humidicola]